jgi:hypothetical protein
MSRHVKRVERVEPLALLLALALHPLALACTPSEPQPLAIDDSSPSAPPETTPRPEPTPTPPLEGPGIGEGTIQLKASGLTGCSTCAEPLPMLVRVLAGPLSTEHTNARVNGALPELRRCVAAQTSAKALEVTLTVELTAAGRVDAVTAQLDTSEAVELGESERAIGRCASVLLESWQFAAAERGSTFEIAFTSE